jgi:phage shock protein A
MEETLVEVRASAARSIADQKELRRQVAKLDELQANWTEKAELALSRGREDLARAALVEREKLAEMAERLAADAGVIEESLRASEGDIAKLQAKLREARTRQNAIATRLESAQNRTRLRQMYAGERTEDAFSKFALLERHADYAEGEAEALLLAAPPKSLEEEIAELRNSDKIDAELARMKAARLTDR